MLFMHLLMWSLKEGKVNYREFGGAFPLAWFSFVELMAELAFVAACVL